MTPQSKQDMILCLLSKHEGLMRKVLTIITAATGLRVSIGDEELMHALEKHFLIPKIKLLEIVEQVLSDPTEVYEEPGSNAEKTFFLFYRLEVKAYLVAVVKKIDDEAFFVTLYPTGQKPKTKHSKLKKVEL